AVAPLAIDAFGQRTLIYRLGKRHVVSCRDLWISVVAEHAVIRNLPAEAFVIAPVVTRIHSPVAALFGVPSERKLDQVVARGPVQVYARVVAGTHDEIDLLLHDVDLPAIG